LWKKLQKYIAFATPFECGSLKNRLKTGRRVKQTDFTNTAEPRLAAAAPAGPNRGLFPALSAGADP